MIATSECTFANRTCTNQQENVTQAAVRTELLTWMTSHGAQPVTAWQLRGWPLDQQRLGPTPNIAHGAMCAEAQRMQRTVAFIASCLGTPITYPSMQQATSDVQQVYPVHGFEHRQSAASSQSALQWHTEHADKVGPPDYLVIACLRNPDGIGTRLSHPAIDNLTAHDQTQLTTPSAFAFKTRSNISGKVSVIARPTIHRRHCEAAGRSNPVPAGTPGLPHRPEPAASACCEQRAAGLLAMTAP